MLSLALSKGDVILIIVFVALPVAAIAFAGAGAVYRQIGKGVFSMEHDLPRSGSGGAPSKEMREAEIRQMLEAKAYRQRARGEHPVDVDEEMGRLMDAASVPGADPSLVEEVRQLVIARNERRMRRGEEPLDVTEEVQRQLRDLEDLGQ